MKKQLTLKKLSLFVLTALLFVLLSLAFAFTGTARAYADGDGQPCPDGQHTLGDIFVVEKQTCVSHGVGVRYCQECGLSFNVVIPADGISHKVNSEGKCSECGAEHVDYVITENLPDKDYVEVGQVEESELKSITIPEKVTTKGQEKEVHVADKAFEGNETITTVTILGTPEIGAEAFKNCKNLTTVTMADGTQNIAADAFVGTPFYNGLLAAAKEADDKASAEDKGQLQPISIPISNGNGSYLLKVVDPTTIKTETSGGSAEPEPEPAPEPSRPRRNAANEAAESPKTFTYKVASGTKVIAEEAFAGLANLVEVTLNPDLLTVGANAFDGCSALKTIYIAKAEGEEPPVTEDSFANVAGLAPYNTIYYWGEPQVDENKKDTIFKALANVIRYYSLTEPTDNTHTYWHFVGEGTVQLPTIWNKAVEIALDTSHCTTRFRKGEAFSSEGLVVKVRYDNETQLKEVTENIDIIYNTYSDAEKNYNKDKPGTYTITVSYLTYLTATYDVTVDDAYTITINYGYEGQATKTELIFVQDGFTLPAAPKREGYKFLGWKVGDAQQLMQAGEKFTPTADTTVTAQWEKLYKVTATAPNASTTLPTGTYYESGTEVTFSVTPANGYKLVSVKNGNATLTAQDGKYSVTVGTSNIEITITTTAVTVTATATDSVDSTTYTVNTNQNGDTATFTLITPTKEGYRFDGWTVKVGSAAPADLEGNTYSLKLQHSDVTVTFTAKWTEMLITSASVALQLNENTLTLVATVTANGFTLENIAGVKLQLGDENPITGSAAEATDAFTLTYTLTALTAKADGYAIKFVLELTKETKDVYQNGTITCGEGHHDFSGNRYALADGKLTVTAPLIVTFDVGGHGTAPAPQSVFAGETLNLDDITEPTATGYVFLYWYTTATDGTETKQSGIIPVTETMTIYAKMGDVVTSSVSIPDYAIANEWTNGNKYGQGTEDNPAVKVGNYISVTATSDKSDTGKYYDGNSGKGETGKGEWRVYQSETPKIYFTAERGAIILSIKITYNISNKGILKYKADEETYASGAEITVNATSAEFTVANTDTATNGQVKITAIEVTYGVVLTEQDKIDMQLAQVASEYTVTTEGEFELPASKNEQVTFKWEVVTANSYVLTNDHFLNINELPVDVDKEVELRLTATCGQTTTTKTVTVTVKKTYNYGSEDAPISVAEALEIAETECNIDSKNPWTSKQIWVTGKVKANPTTTNKGVKFDLVDLTNDNTSILIYEPTGADVDKIAQNDTLVIYGWIEKYNGTLEFTGYGAKASPEVKTRTAGQSTINVETHNATVNGITDGQKLVNDTQVPFTVQVEEGFRITSVTAYGQTLTETDGKYNFTVKGDGKVVVKTVDTSMEVINVTADNLLKDASKNKYDSECGKDGVEVDGYTFSWIGMGNFGMLQMRTNKDTGTSSFWNIDAFQYNITKVVFEWASSQSLPTKANVLKVEFSNSAAFEEGSTSSQTITFETSTYELTVEGSYKFIRITHNNQGAVYLDSVSIQCKKVVEKKVDFAACNLQLENGKPVIILNVDTKGIEATTLQQARLEIDGKEYEPIDGSTFNKDGNSVLKFDVSDAFSLTGSTYNVSLRLDNTTYSKPAKAIAINDASLSGKKGELSIVGDNLVLTLSAEGSVEPEEKSITGIYGQALDQGKLLSFYAKVKGLNASTMTSANTFLVVGETVRIPLQSASNEDNNTKIHFYFDLSKISAVGSGACKLEIEGKTYDMIVDTPDGSDWTLAPTLDNYNVTFSTSGQGSAISMTITAKVNEDQQKADAALNEIKPQLENKELTKDLQLPTVEGVTIAWSVTVTTDGADANAARIDGEYLRITRGAKDIVIQLTANITCGTTGSATLQVTLTIKAEEAPKEITEYNLVTSEDDLKEGYKVLFVYIKDTTKKISGASNVSGESSGQLAAAEGNFVFSSDNSKITNWGTGYAWTLQKNNNYWNFIGDNGEKLGCKARNKITVSPNGQSDWEIKFENGTTKIITQYVSTNFSGAWLQCNTSNNYTFAPFTSSQGAIKIYISNAPASTTGGGTDPTPGGGSEVKKGEMTIDSTHGPWGGNSYAQNTGTFSYSDITFSVKDVTFQQSMLQFKGDSGYLKNTTPFPGRILSIKINDANATFTLTLGTTSACSDKTIQITSGGQNNNYTAVDGEAYLYFSFARVEAGGTNRVSSIVIEYEPASSDQGMEGPSTLSYTANMNNGNVESDGLWLALALGGSALLLVSSLAVVLLLRKHN